MRPELLSPAGSPEALRAAVQGGCNAVYLGWGTFNARQGAKNFSDTEFADALRYCHERGVRVFLTLNTLVTDRELADALETARCACRLGVDAVLVQDWGLFDLLRRTLPDLPLHASTQMSIFTSGAANELAGDGCERVVLARECSAEDTAAICQNCEAEVEVFVHGALCMCYSGQCAMSAMLGGNSGNRGRCKQPCRLPYEVVPTQSWEDPLPEPTRKATPDTYPLSLKDNCLSCELEAMARMGVDCLKLEGRMKRPEYVAVVTGIYARLLAEGRGPTAAESQELELAFSRSGFTDDYWQGRHGPDMFGVRPEHGVEPKELFAKARSAYEKGDLKTVPVRFFCTIRSGEAALLRLQDPDGHTVTVTGAVPEPARTRSLTAEEVEARLGKTGGTAYRCAEAQAQVEEGLSLSAGALNALRRDALSALSEVRTAPPCRREEPTPPLPDPRYAPSAPAYTLSLTTANQLTPELLACRPQRISLPLEICGSVSALPAMDGQWCAELPRVWRDRDEAQLRTWIAHAKELGVSGLLVGNIGGLSLARESGLALYGDYGLNVFNSRSLAYLRQKALASACVSFELRFAQIRDLEKVLPTEAIVYGRLPLMVTENCLIQNSVGCRCDRPNFLRDRTGAAFPLLPVYGHRTEVQNSKTLYLADRPELYRLGLAYARLRFTTESPERCAQVVRAYLNGDAPQGDFTRGLYERGVE